MRYCSDVTLQHARMYFLLHPWVMSLHASITRDDCYIRKDLHVSNSLSAHASARTSTCECKKIHACVCNVTSEQYRIYIYI